MSRRVSEILKDLSGEVFLRFPRRPFSKKKKASQRFSEFLRDFPGGQPQRVPESFQDVPGEPFCVTVCIF